MKNPHLIYFCYRLSQIKDKNKGMTLLELLIVTLIIGLLSAIALPNLLQQIDKARYSQAILDMDCVADQLRGHFLERQYFPRDVNRNTRPSGGINCFPISSQNEIPFNSSYDYESWNTSGDCYIQITFLGKNGTRESPTNTALFPTPGLYDEHPSQNIGDDLILSLGIFDVACQ